jgi:hypothetical protein
MMFFTDKNNYSNSHLHNKNLRKSWWKASQFLLLSLGLLKKKRKKHNPYSMIDLIRILILVGIDD